MRRFSGPSRPGTPGRGVGGEEKEMEPIEFARNLRQTSRRYEQLLWQLLRN